MFVRFASLPAVIVLLAFSSASVAQTNVEASAQTRYVFFDFGKPVLTRDAEAVLDEVAEAAREQAGSVLEVTGFSDAAGPRRANAAVSRRRAEVVRAYLQARGVAARMIRVGARGEQGLLIPTSDGVREAQNRRVEIRQIRREP